MLGSVRPYDLRRPSDSVNHGLTEVESSKMKIAIGADHQGFRLKRVLTEHLKKKGHDIIDFGTFSKESCDYPVYSHKVAEAVSKKKAHYGIFICKTGIGSAMALNKTRGVRAALVHNLKGAKLSRLHNNANVLVLGADFVNVDDAKKIATTWLKTAFEGGRHSRRVNQIGKIEQGHGF